MDKATKDDMPPHFDPAGAAGKGDDAWTHADGGPYKGDGPFTGGKPPLGDKPPMDGMAAADDLPGKPPSPLDPAMEKMAASMDEVAKGDMPPPVKTPDEDYGHKEAVPTKPAHEEEDVA